MQAFEYKVVPAPSKGLKTKGVRSTEGRFAVALETVMNELGAEGWEYQRTDTLPCEEREGLIGKTTNFQHMLVFRRPLQADDAADAAPTALIEDHSDAVEPAPAAEPAKVAAPEIATPAAPQSAPTVPPVARVPEPAPRPNLAAE